MEVGILSRNRVLWKLKSCEAKSVEESKVLGKPTVKQVAAMSGSRDAVVESHTYGAI